jgi:hypothetical protein
MPGRSNAYQQAQSLLRATCLAAVLAAQTPLTERFQRPTQWSAMFPIEPLLCTHESNQSHSRQHGSIVLRRAAHNESDEHNNGTAHDEPPSAEQVTVGTADHEGNRHGHGIQAYVECCSARIAELCCGYGLTGAEGRDNPETNAIGESEDPYEISACRSKQQL